MRPFLSFGAELALMVMEGILMSSTKDESLTQSLKTGVVCYLLYSHWRNNNCQHDPRITKIALLYLLLY